VSGRERPLVYASPSARRQADELFGTDVVIETVVSRAIEKGAVTFGRDPRVHADDGSWTARVRRRPGLLRDGGSRSWLVLEIARTNLEIHKPVRRNDDVDLVAQ
jgi:hypothetical protein